MCQLKVQALSFLDYGPFDLDIKSGEVFGISGTSGSGKSLFLKALADLIVSKGQVSLAGEAREADTASDWRKKVMLVPPEPQWWFEKVGAHFPGNSQEIAWESFGLAEDVLSWPVSQLSSGEKQRLGLARAMAREPLVLLLDEPTANLDQNSAEKIENCILNYLHKKRALAVWVSHDEKQLERVATSRAVMENKALVEMEVAE
ncbi:MAG: ABC transporter ATP-binding protein [Verrucomicrobia bacterium]|nr:ABC transporter ATP-binding protein [Verrucomicrobiota bacterium]